MEPDAWRRKTRIRRRRKCPASHCHDARPSPRPVPFQHHAQPGHAEPRPLHCYRCRNPSPGLLWHDAQAAACRKMHAAVPPSQKLGPLRPDRHLQPTMRSFVIQDRSPCLPYSRKSRQTQNRASVPSGRPRYDNAARRRLMQVWDPTEPNRHPFQPTQRP